MPLERPRPLSVAPLRTAGPALRNGYGENNCFLNTVLQQLWHCGAFRQRMLATPADAVAGEDAESIPTSRVLLPDCLNHACTVVWNNQLGS